MIKSILPKNVKFIGFEKPEPNHLCSVDIQEESPPPLSLLLSNKNLSLC